MSTATDFTVSILRANDGSLPELGQNTIRFQCQKHNLDLPELIASWSGLKLLMASSHGVDQMTATIDEMQRRTAEALGDADLDEILAAAGIAVSAERDTKRVRLRTSEWTLSLDGEDAAGVAMLLIGMAGRVGLARRENRTS